MHHHGFRNDSAEYHAACGHGHRAGPVTCATPEITINGLGSSQGPNFTYEWSGPSFVCCETTLEPVINQGGTYTLTVTNTDNGCTATASVTIQENTNNPVLTVNFTNPACNGSNNGSIQVSATGGTPPFTYVWDDGPTGPNRNNLPPGTYTVTVTNANGCSEVASVTLEEPDPLVATITPDVQIDCNNSSSNPTLDVSGGTPDYTFLWSNNSNQQNPSFTTGGTYTVTVTDDNNCTTTASVTIPQNTTPPVATATAPGPVNCTNPEITINGLGSSQGPNFTYEWSGPSFVCCETTLEPVINQGGTYTLTVTDANGCTATQTFDVVTGIEELLSGLALAVFPNPTSGAFTLALDGLTGEVLAWELRDLAGRLVDAEVLGARTGEVRIAFDVAEAASGVYLLNVQSGSTRSTVRVLVQH